MGNEETTKAETCVIEQQFADVVNLIQRTQNEVFRVANTALIDLYLCKLAHTFQCV